MQVENVSNATGFSGNEIRLMDLTVNSVYGEYAIICNFISINIVPVPVFLDLKKAFDTIFYKVFVTCQQSLPKMLD